MRQTIIDYAKSFIGKPYRWGGNGPLGFDCSGFVQEVLASVGLDPKGDQSAQALYDYFTINGRLLIVDTPSGGDLVFYGENPKRISHIALMLNDWQQIGANSGDSTCTDLVNAERLGAMVKVRPWNYRKDFIAFVRIKELSP